MNEHEFLGRLAEAARLDAPPALDVSGQVMRTIRRRRARTPNVVLGYFAAAAAVAAAVVVIAALQSWQGMQDPLLAMANAMGPMLQ